MKIGFIGLGAMGRPMAMHLQQAGYELFVWMRRPDATIDFPATRCISPCEVGQQCEVVFTMVTSSADVDSVVMGDAGSSQAGLIEGMAPGSVLIDCSTIGPEVARDLAKQLAKKGIDMLDAPVSGGEQGAIDASLAIMVGGSAAVLARVMPLLECLGQRVFHVGSHGAGQVAKACNQMIMVAAIQASAEAMYLAAANGLDCAKVRQALAGGSAASKVLDTMGQKMVSRDFTAGVEARLHHKDFGLLLQAARTAGVYTPLAAAVGQQLNALMAQGWGCNDTAALLKVLEKNDTD